MDEPFGSVDAMTRLELEDGLLKLWKEIGTTILFVTHDIEEAIYLSDRLYVLGRRHAVAGVAGLFTQPGFCCLDELFSLLAPRHARRAVNVYLLLVDWLIVGQATPRITNNESTSNH